MIENIKHYFNKSYELSSKMWRDDVLHEQIQSAARLMIDALKSGKKIMACGNGGSMSDAMHFCSELTGRYRHSRQPIAAMPLSDPGAMSCIANDFGYEFVFSRQVIALGSMDDVLLAISTSGKSINVLRAASSAKLKGMIVVVLAGENGLDLTNDWDYCDVQIKVPSTMTNHIQESHIQIIHLLVELIEQHLTPKSI